MTKTTAILLPDMPENTLPAEKKYLIAVATGEPSDQKVKAMFIHFTVETHVQEDWNDKILALLPPESEEVRLLRNLICPPPTET